MGLSVPACKRPADEEPEIDPDPSEEGVQNAA